MAKKPVRVRPEQVKAARALVKLEQDELARRASVSVTTVRRVEAGDGFDQVAWPKVEAVVGVLEEAGVEFIPDGVRKRVPMTDLEWRYRTEEVEAAVALFEASHADGKADLLTDDDLYDADGLPR
jgi:predicted transcriptional regulator